MNLLTGKTFVDFSHRLPGPYASMILEKMGAKIIKIEDQKFGDSFNTGAFSAMDSSFKLWYRNLNEKKEILGLDFNDQNAINKIKDILLQSDGVILSLPKKVQQKLGLDESFFMNAPRPQAVLYMGSSANIKKSMHDLNALALSGLLKLHIAGETKSRVAPPFLPLSGLAFGQKAAMDLIALSFKAKEENKSLFHTTYLYETTEELFSAFWPKESREKNDRIFLHNGLYPCYNIYRLKDGEYVALAAVEEKFWEDFKKVFSHNIDASLRFHHQDDSVFKKLEELFAKHTSSNIEKLIEDQDICLTLI